MADHLVKLSKKVVEECTECPLCRQECAFLEKYGNPKAIAGRIDFQDGAELTLAYECSLCGLCAAVCPVDLRPRDLFIEMRREAVCQGLEEFPKHKALLKYEKRGTSKRYTWYGLPQGCDTVLFPGCALSGARPETGIHLFRHLQQNNPDLGIVLDCCTKPSLDLGRKDFFQAMFGEMCDYLMGQGIQKILVACPNCYKVFKEYGEGFEVKTVYEDLAANGSAKINQGTGEVTIHDPCVIRFEPSIQNAVRKLIEGMDLAILEMEHNKETTLCCGEGGAVGFFSPELAGRWAGKRKREAQGKRIITYCYGCVNHLNPHSPTSHILDLFFQLHSTLSGKIRISRSPWTYWNRLCLKHWFRKNSPAVVHRERES